MTKTITEDEFVATYKPIKNPIDDNASYSGAMLETFGPELEMVLKAAKEKPNNVWTVTDCDGLLVIGSGYHFVNRIGYFITEVPFTEDIQAFDPEEAEEAENWVDEDEDTDSEDSSAAPRG